MTQENMHKFCSNESDYHQLIINHLSQFPDECKSNPGLSLFTWSHEVDLHDAGRGGGNGSADLLIVDEEGMVWLIEAKFDKTTEKGHFVWCDQLPRYKRAIETMDWTDIVAYVHKFLLGVERTKPSIKLPLTTASLEEVFTIWENHLGRSLVSPDILCRRIKNHLQSGTYGLMILTDIQDVTYADCAENFIHDGPLAYLQGIPTENGVDYRVIWLRPSKDKFRYSAYEGGLQSPFLAQKRIICTPEALREGLAENVRPLWTSIIEPGLSRLYCSFENKKEMGFDVCVSRRSRRGPALLIGWPERDDKRVPREQKRFGTAAMRVDIHIKRLFDLSGYNDKFINRWMKEFYSLGWRGRFSNRMYHRWGVTDISPNELGSKAQGIMRYLPHNDTSCFSGRTGDEDVLIRFMTALDKMLEELN